MRLRDRDGRRAEVLDKQAAEVTIANAETRGKLTDAGVIESAFGDFTECAGHGGGRAVPGRSARGAFGPASQTRPQPGCRCGGSRRVVIDVLLARRAGGTDRPAENLRRANADEEAAVETRVTREAGFAAGFAIECHFSVDYSAGAGSGLAVIGRG